MIEIIIGLATFTAILGGFLFGIQLQRVLPQAHLKNDSQRSVADAMNVVSTLTALVLGLLLTNVSSAYSVRADAVGGLAASVQRLHSALRDYGTDASSANSELRRYLILKVHELSTAAPIRSGTNSVDVLEGVTRRIVALRPADNLRRLEQDRALQIVSLVADERWRIVESNHSNVPLPFYALVIAWLGLMFTSYGTFAPRNSTVIGSFFFCGLAISGTVYVIAEFDNPTSGYIRISVQPLKQVAADF